MKINVSSIVEGSSHVGRSEEKRVESRDEKRKVTK